jgi:hypothetical protein
MMNLRLIFMMMVSAILLPFTPAQLGAEETSAGTDAVKGYLLTQVAKIDQAAHDYQDAAEEYQKIIDTNGGDYNKAAQTSGAQILPLVARMQRDYWGLHMNGYETVEGIAAGVKSLVQYDVYFDSGVPQSQASTDSPSAPIELKTASGEVIDNRNGNLFHYVIEPLLWGAKASFVKKLNASAAASLHGIAVLPRADIALASAKDAVRESDLFQQSCQNWQPTVAECLGALVWMTPTFNTYYDDLKDSLYNPNSFIHVSESRVKDMRGIMGSLQLVYVAISPLIEGKDSALADQLKAEYQNIMDYIDETDTRDQKARAEHNRLAMTSLEEMAHHAKTMSDQLAPQLMQAAAILGVRVPPKPGMGGMGLNG